MRLTGAQVTRIQEAVAKYNETLDPPNSRHTPPYGPHVATETLVDDILSITREVRGAPGPSDLFCDVPGCINLASFVSPPRVARCMSHRNA